MHELVKVPDTIGFHTWVIKIVNRNTSELILDVVQKMLHADAVESVGTHLLNCISNTGMPIQNNNQLKTIIVHTFKHHEKNTAKSRHSPHHRYPKLE